MTQSGRQGAPLKIFLVAAEESGDRLGGALMRALRERASGGIAFAGVGGQDMIAAGLTSLHPIGDFSIIGFSAIPRRLPMIVGRLRETVRAVLAQRPDVLVIIDSPGYTLWIARFVHLANRAIPIVDYVSPSVWAWRPWRARSMRRYIAHVLALLPFEPEVHRRLGGPPCTYVGHPLAERISSLRPNPDEARRRNADPPVLLVLPGSRGGEISRLLAIFGEAVGRVGTEVGPLDVVLPTVPHLLDRVTAETAGWPIRPRIVVETADKEVAYRVARVALAKSGTVTLELALAGVPMVAAYKVSAAEAFVVRRMVRVPSYILANLIIGENVVPEIVQDDCTPDRLVAALVPLIRDTPERQRQLAAFARLDTILQIGAATPALRAAEIVLATVGRAPQ
jgi:lipid-A-disaccharide synthase